MQDSRKKINWFWAIVIALLFAVLIVWFSSPTREVAQDGTPETDAPIAEFTTAPEGGVPVNLPDTPMTNVPPQSQDSVAADVE